LKGDALKQSLNRSIDDMLELLHSKLR